MKRLITALLCIAMLATASGCATTTADTPTPTTAVTTTQATTVTTTTTDTTVTTTETPATTTGTPETTTAPVTTDAPITTETPVTTETPATTTVAPVTTETPVTTTTAPVTTTTAPVTTAPVTTTKTPETEPPHTHSYSAWTTTKEATCTADGKQTRTCSCGKSETKTIEATGHSYGDWKTTAEATCTDKGSKSKTCSACGDKKTESIASLGHNWGNWTETKKATETANGEETRTCKNCKKTETRKTDKIAHTHKFGEWKLCDDYINEKATCTSCGETKTQIHYANPETDEQLVADRVIYYINQFRAEEGTASATKLERMTQVAQLRSTYLIGLTSSSSYEEWHDDDATLKACAYYKYGKKTPNGTYNFETGEFTYDGTYFYQNGCSGEAVGHNYWSANKTIDDIAFGIAYQVYCSSSHWSYVGSSENPYIAVGVCEDGGRAYFAIWVSTTNKYETVYND